MPLSSRQAKRGVQPIPKKGKDARKRKANSERSESVRGSKRVEENRPRRETRSVSVIVVSSYLPKLGERAYRSEKFRVVGLPCGDDDLDYYRGLEVVWGGNHTIVNVEHDMECSDELIQDLLDCPHPACTHAYPLRQWGHIAHRHGPLPPAGSMDWWLRPDEEEEWATYGGIGFCKMTPEARVRPLSEPREWPTLDVIVARAVEGPEVVPHGAYEGKRWHVHWPAIEHYHPPGA